MATLTLEQAALAPTADRHRALADALGVPVALVALVAEIAELTAAELAAREQQEPPSAPRARRKRGGK